MKNKALITLIVGFLLGVLFTTATGWYLMPGLMLSEHQSPYDMQKTAEIIKQNALNEGWVVAGEKHLDKSIKKHINKEIKQVHLIELCQADHAYRILEDDSTRLVSVMMPCTISVYEKEDGSVFVATMNAGLLGKMFGGKIAEVMGEKVSAQQKAFISFTNKGDQNE